MAVTIESEHDTPVQYEHTLHTGVESTHVQVDQKLEAAAKSHITWSVEGQQGERVLGLFNRYIGIGRNTSALNVLNIITSYASSVSRYKYSSDISSHVYM